MQNQRKIRSIFKIDKTTKGMMAMFVCLILAISTTSLPVYADGGWRPSIDRYKYVEPWYEESFQLALDWQIIPSRFTKLPMNVPITRGEFAEAMVLAYVRATGTLPADWSNTSFADETNAYAQVASTLNLVSGYGDGRFKPQGEIKREELFVMMERLMGVLGSPESMATEVTDTDLAPADKASREDEVELLLKAFTDYDQISGWAKSATATMVKHNIVTGTDQKALEPQKYITRAQAMVVLMKGVQTGVPEPVSAWESNEALYQMISSVSKEMEEDTDESSEASDYGFSRGGRYRSYDMNFNALYSIEEQLVMLGNNPAKYALIFGDETAERYQTAEEALTHMVKITVDVWVLNSDGTKSTGKRSLTVHAALAETFMNVFKEIYEGDEKFPIKNIGGYAWRASGTSEHRWGLAVDINSDENYMIRSDGTVVAGSLWLPGENPYSIKPSGDVVRAFMKYGFTWGGDAWSMSNDYMHFSFLGE